MGLHMYDVYEPDDYLWVDCRPVIPQSWVNWKNQGGIDERCGRTRADKEWEMKVCDGEHGEVVCQNFTQGMWLL